MSTLRISNIEAKSVPASATIDEKVKITNSSGDTLVFIDGKTSGITTVGINTTDSNITFDANSNIVVTGIITATRFSGQITPTSLEIGSNIKLGNAGVITATSFVGSGANLTNLPTQVTITGNADNRIITGGSGVNLTGESNFTYDGNEVAVYAQTDDTDCVLSLVGKTASGGVGQAGRTAIIAESSNNSNGQSKMHFRTRNTSNAQLIAMTIDGDQKVGIGTQYPSAAFLDIASTQPTDSLRMRRISSDALVASNWSMKPYGGNLYFRSGGSTDRIYFDDSGDLYIMDGDLKIATSGHGIDFSATADGASGSYLNSEVLSDYERGRFEPRFLENGTTDSNYAWRYGQYVKIGNIVHVHMAFGISSKSGNFTTAFIGGLPFTMSSQWGTNDFSYVQLIGYSYASGYGDSGNTTQISMELNQTHGTMHRVVQGQGKSNVNQSSIGGSQRFAFQFSYPTA